MEPAKRLHYCTLCTHRSIVCTQITYHREGLERQPARTVVSTRLAQLAHAETVVPGSSLATLTVTMRSGRVHGVIGLKCF